MTATPLISQCPDCARILSFRSQETTMRICSHCGAVVQRKPDGTILSKPSFLVLEHNDIIQPGTTGVWNKKRFEVLGRFRAWFEESAFNYWTIAFEAGDIAFLAEGYGIYQVLTPHATAAPAGNRISMVDPAELIELLPDQKFIVDRKLKAIKWDIEGELFIPVSAETNIGFLECSAQSGRDLQVFEWSSSQRALYEVHFSSFSDLQLENLRAYQSSQKSFQCKKCKTEITVKTFPYAQSCSCSECGTYHELNNGLNFQKEGSASATGTLLLPLGCKGVLNHIEYEVVGFTRKEEQNSYHSKWNEYTLYSPSEGFAFLSEYEGHWIYLRENPDSPVLLNQNNRDFRLDGVNYRLFNSYSAKVIDARGEFPYNIFDNDNAKAREFIAPPRIWIQERHPKEGIIWYSGKHVSPKEIKTGFGLDALPYRKGIGAIQPTSYLTRGQLFVAVLVGLALLLLSHFLISGSKEERVLLDAAYSFPDSLSEVTQVAGKYTFEKKHAIVAFDIQAPVDNSWFELGATLVNSSTGKEYSMEKGVEYYAGYSDGESWSEGSTTATGYITQVPAGDYLLQLTGTRESTGTMSAWDTRKVQNFYVKIIYDVPAHRNLGWAIAMLLLWPLGSFAIGSMIENMRWSNSPFSNNG